MQWLQDQAIFYDDHIYRRQSILCDKAICNALHASIETVRVARSFVTNVWVSRIDYLTTAILETPNS
ncbi:hypothetical protein NTGHW29_210014 [Candidatus Nitrotoga sp. HW29]|uniref:hypothetical protein n=1 Tax=Candidatus Nitrotoga sp. HW29 TaxID=2886963 RepID=UPI001EF1DFCC|nr:hypothetical protein [Candidatus Nitrotoga sp. HW29]CAH1904118.1 hypothetical protein NTGHW29_210014 [Candidatus Nitrotoga sp. HW29]